MKKKLLLVAMMLVLVVSSFALTGCGGSDDSTSEDTSWTYIKDKGELIVGLDDTFAPMGFRDEDNNLVGFDIDLATAVCKELGLSLIHI